MSKAHGRWLGILFSLLLLSESRKVACGRFRSKLPPASGKPKNKLVTPFGMVTCVRPLPMKKGLTSCFSKATSWVDFQCEERMASPNFSV